MKRLSFFFRQNSMFWKKLSGDFSISDGGKLRQHLHRADSPTFQNTTRANVGLCMLTKVC
jgi:hypothetical protein